MPKIDLGSVGAVIAPDGGGVFVDQAVQLEALGYSTIWVTGGPMQHLGQLADAVAATEAVRVASGIIAVVKYPVEDVVALYQDLEAKHPGRFVVGLGGAHGARPIDTLVAYFDRLDAAGVPQDRRILAALGPRMVDLAAERAAGAYSVLVTPSYVADTRVQLRDDTTLALDQIAVYDTDPASARATARGVLGFLGTMPAYQANFRRMGLTDADIAEQSDRLIDELVVWGDAATIAGRVRAQLAAGADHVAVSIQPPPDGPFPIDAWTAVSTELGLT